MISQSRVVTMPPEQAAKFVIPKIEKTNNEVTSITLTLPLLSAKNSYLVIHFPEEPVRTLMDRAKMLPKEQQVSFVQEWLVKNQNIALNQYLHDTSVHSFRCDTISPIISKFVIPRVRPHLITLTTKSTDKFAKIKLSLPLIVKFDKMELEPFSFHVNLRLVHLTTKNLTRTSILLTNTIRNQITVWAGKNHFNANSRQFKLALQDALSHISISLREQVRKLKHKNKTLVHYLDSH